MSTESSTESSPDEFVNVATAARILGVSKMFIYRMVDSGELPSYRFGRSIRIKRRTLDLVVERALVEPIGSRTQKSK